MPKKKKTKKVARKSTQASATEQDLDFLFPLPDLPDAEGETEELVGEIRSQLQQLNEMMAAELPEVDEEALLAANEIFVDALDAKTRKARLRGVREALKICPECADAWLCLSRELDLSPPERILYIERATEAGRAIIGDAFMDMIGAFWGYHETRPYMRALEEQARHYDNYGHLEAAIEVWEMMLNLNPNDNQGVRDPLASAYLLAGRLDDARDLLDRYRDDESAALSYARALESFLRHGDKSASRQARQQALASNAHLVLFVTGANQLPNDRPEMYQLGSPEEAILVAEHAVPAWKKYPEAINWLTQG